MTFIRRCVEYKFEYICYWFFRINLKLNDDTVIGKVLIKSLIIPFIRYDICLSFDFVKKIKVKSSSSEDAKTLKAC